MNSSDPEGTDVESRVEDQLMPEQSGGGCSDT